MDTHVFKERKFVSQLNQVLSLCMKFFSMIMLVLLPVRPIMIAVAVLVFADFITGVMASRKEGKPITSSGFKKTVGKVIAYQSAVIVSFVIETYLMQGIPAVKAVAGLIALTEGKSFFENLHRITGIDYWARMLGLLQSNVEKNLPKLPDDKK